MQLTDEQIDYVWDGLDGTKIISGSSCAEWNKQIRRAFARALLAANRAEARSRYDPLDPGLEANFHDELKGFLSKRDQGKVMGMFRRAMEEIAAPAPVSEPEQPNQDEADLCERIIHAVEGECDGLALTEEQASNILAYLQYGAPMCDMPEAFHIVDNAIGAAEEYELEGGNLRIVTLRIDAARKVRAALASHSDEQPSERGNNAPSADREQVGETEADARRMRTLCRLLDSMDDMGNGFPGEVHAAFQDGAKRTREALDAQRMPGD